MVYFDSPESVDGDLWLWFDFGRYQFWPVWIMVLCVGKGWHFSSLLKQKLLGDLNDLNVKLDADASCPSVILKKDLWMTFNTAAKGEWLCICDCVRMLHTLAYMFAIYSSQSQPVQFYHGSGRTCNKLVAHLLEYCYLIYSNRKGSLTHRFYTGVGH